MATRVNQLLDHLSDKEMSDTAEIWNSVPLAPPDPLFRLTAGFATDTCPQKIDLGVGAYRDDDSKPWVLPVVKKASHILINDLNYEYLPITGLPSFTSAAASLILGSSSPALKEERVVSVQSISGTGANHLAALFLSKFYDWKGTKEVWVSNPTWANHPGILKNVYINPMVYPYYSPVTIGLDFPALISTFSKAPRHSIFILHPCAHNPTGVDPTQEQWKEIAKVMKERNHFAWFDSAYQGFASGDLDRDGWAIRHFVEQGVRMLVCQSFAKNAGMYGERVGALHIVTPSKESAGRVKSQLSALQRSEISNPPSHGARIVSLILNDAGLFEEWKEDIKTMANRVIAMRKELHRLLSVELKTPGNWDHIVKQIGMFSYTGISAEQSRALTDKAHVYLTTNGRISMAGLNTKNVRYFAENLDKAVRGQL